MRGIILLVAAFIVFSPAAAQNIIIRTIELAGEKVIIHYDLDDNSPNHEYLLSLYSSKDNFSSPLNKVKGDIGPEVKPGTGKRVEWNIREELGGFKGRISLEIRGRVFVPFVKLQNFDASKSYKRGKTYDITWKVGNNDPIHIELYKGSQRISGELNQPNNGAYSLTIPSNAETGKDYRIKITDSKSSDFVVYTDYFKVTPKVSLLIKVLPLVAVVGAVAALGGGSKGGSSTGTTENGPIPLPALPTGN